MKGKKIVAATALSALIIGGAFSYANTSNEPIQPPEVGVIGQEQVKKVDVPLDTFKQYGLTFDLDRKVIHDIAGNIIIQFKDGKTYDVNGEIVTYHEFREILKEYEGMGVHSTDPNASILELDALMAGVNPEGKTNKEIAEEIKVKVSNQMGILKGEAELMGIDISDLTNEEIIAKVDQEREVFLQSSIEEGIEQLKLAYQLDSKVYQDAGIDLTDKTDEEIKTMAYEVYENPSIDLPVNENGTYAVIETPAAQILNLFLDLSLIEWDKTLSEAKELGVDTFGHHIGNIRTLNWSMEQAIEMGMDTAGKTSNEINDMVQEYYKEKHMEETGQTEEEFYADRP
ncbi:hypothetical protein [Chengkuizengella axinellae]|uniref:Uncharacterized protein n=1 Tax=Chengkuizengella axinellae TaxID=3064388 RepID=A0ABT9J2X3_9BACL|nr:hypothetical protein [Chengkuizengella sp. 2205SS18-9]MDP5275965.1 hypothetical protein [Chengkuizengella sp. 2205SS18-9]